MKDSPTQPSILMRNPSRLEAPELLLGHRNDVHEAGLERDRHTTADWRQHGRHQALGQWRDDIDAAETHRWGHADAAGQCHAVGGAHVDAAADLIADLQRALRRSGVLGSGKRPLYVPPTWYSRDDTAVVSGAITRWISSLADTVCVHPSGAWVVAGGDDSTRPSSAGTASGGGAAAVGASAETASVFGSATAIGVVREGQCKGSQDGQRTNQHSAALLGGNSFRQGSLREN
jgi:hypothetical protein